MHSYVVPFKIVSTTVDWIIFPNVFFFTQFFILITEQSYICYPLSNLITIFLSERFLGQFASKSYYKNQNFCKKLHFYSNFENFFLSCCVNISELILLLNKLIILYSLTFIYFLFMLVLYSHARNPQSILHAAEVHVHI